MIAPAWLARWRTLGREALTDLATITEPPTFRDRLDHLIADLDANAVAWRKRGLDGQAQEAEQTAARLRAITQEGAA